jgi:Fur family transcriptional regulator, ferric uptake regulator
MSGASSASELKELLRSVGLRVTRARVAVLRQLLGAKRPISHAEIVEALEGEAWDRVTLYRNLTDLVQAGLARKVELGDRVWRFDAGSSNTAHDAALHPHFVCTVCGTVACLPETAVTTTDPAAPSAVRERVVEVQLRGICDACTS